MKILQVDLQKAKDNIKNEIEGYPRVERWNILPFLFLYTVLKHSNTFVVFKKPTENLTGKTSSPGQHSAFREL